MPGISDSSIRTCKTVAVVVSMYKEQLSTEEQISFKHLVHFLDRYDKYLTIPENLHLDYPGFKVKCFNSRFFKSIASYSKLLLSRQFYEAFIEYEYILIYQLDCLVFSDELIQWCDTGLDYIGAPWLKSGSRPYEGFSQVGNGGLSLRKIESFLKVIDSPRYFVVEPEEYWQDFYASKPKYGQYWDPLRKLRRRLRYFNARWRMSRYPKNEDYFWSREAEMFYPDFKVAPIEVGLRFSFERAPRFCFEQNNHRLPFGCHAWSKYDRDFWKPYLLK